MEYNIFGGISSCGKGINMSQNNHDKKHLTYSQRVLIESELNCGASFASIARKIDKDPSTISKEVRRHITHHIKRDRNANIPCSERQACRIRGLCIDHDCIRLCRICEKPGFSCTNVCHQYKPKICEKLNKPPYVCNACNHKNSCLLKTSYYMAKFAEEAYRDLLLSSREGINQAPVDIAMLDGLISPLLRKGQSMAHIYAHHAKEIPCCRKTLYNYIDKSVFSARNIDMRRRVHCKVRKKPTRISLTVREFRTNRTYDDFLKLIKDDPNIPVVEMDTVEGGKSKSQKVFLTMFFRNCSLMVMFLLKEKTGDCVAEIFDYLTARLGEEVFSELFPIILTDNGAEFQRPEQLETALSGKNRTHIYYCNPHSSWQKGMIEKNHEYIRLVIPKGKSLEPYTTEDTTLLMNHINSEARDSLNGCTPFKLSQMLLNNLLHHVLELVEISPDQVHLKPDLLKK